MENPTAADWIAAFGTGGALVLGVLVLFREQRDRRRTQARQVNAWAVGILPKRETTETGVTVGMKGNCVKVTAQNNSLEPVYDIHVSGPSQPRPERSPNRLSRALNTSARAAQHLRGRHRNTGGRPCRPAVRRRHFPRCSGSPLAAAA